MNFEDMDREERGNQLTNAMDAMVELLTGQAPGMAPASEKLASLMALVAAEAHALLDTAGRGYRDGAND